MSIGGGVEIRRDLAYAAAGELSLKLDLYLPESRAGACPVVLYLHGGAFMVGARTDFAQERLLPVARGGVAVASAAYRFSDVVTYPAQVHDVKAAVRWLRAHASEHGYDATRVGAWGASAGGYLALMLGVTAGSSEHEGEQGDDLDADSSVDAVAAWFAPAELLSTDVFLPPPDWPLPPFISGPPPQPSILARLLGVERVTDDPGLAAAASPVTYASRATASFLLMQGDRDAVIAEDQSRRMHESLVQSGADSTLLLIAGANHEDPAFDGPAVLGAVSEFFRAKLR
ncbi:MAG: alpha/beta hydrolase fold domain-containing protein [Solirubrobacteraceae bacterium]